METQDPPRESAFDRIRSPIAAAAILLVIYVAMYLAVGALVHLLGAPADARVATPGPELASATSAQSRGADRITPSQVDPGAHAD